MEPNQDFAMPPIPTEPVHLVEDPATGDRLLIYGTDRGIKIELRYDGDTLWVTQAQIAELFGRDVSTISRHINNILEEGELSEGSSLQKTQITPGRPSVLYSLDMVISVGYRVSSSQATLFRRWATDKLVQFAIKGFVIDAEQLKTPAARDRVAELKEIIRDIRSDEANVYREIRRICSLCSDYDPKSAAWHEFYAHAQAKLMYAVTTHTPSEMVVSRANADHDNMGLRSWKGDHVTKADVDVSKNYLSEGEIREFNRLTVILLDIFEDQLDLGKISTMVAVEALLDLQLKSLNRELLRGGGSVKAAQAKAHALEQYRAFDQKRKTIRHAEADAALAALRAQEKLLPKTPRKSTKKPS
jgi:hypothetical protein